MTYQLTSAYIGAQPIANTETTQKHPLGTIVRANDPTYGEGEFIYLKGIANTTVGSPVTYNASDWTTALAPVGTNIPEPIGFAMSANVASQYGWYQIGGHAVGVKATAALTAGTAIGIQTAGFVNATATGKEVFNAVVSTTTTAADATVLLLINRPHMQGRIT